jgi:hypothetical protein
MDPTDKSPVILPLDAADRDAYRAADKAWRTAAIRRNAAERKRARSEQAKGAGHKDTTDAAKARDDFDSTAKGHEATKQTVRDAAIAKAGHAATPFTDIGYDPVRGHLVGKREPLLRGTPPVERKRVPMTDKDADDYADAYVAGCEAQSDAADLRRQVEEYKAAHPALFASGPGEPPPVDPTYEKLKADLAAKQKVVQEQMAAQQALAAKYLTGETYTYCRLDITTGDVVLGDNVPGG